MPVTGISSIGRRHCIPILYTRGTHYDVGFDTGRTFASIISNFLEISTSLNEEYLPAYETKIGRKAYEDTLESVKKNFPQYVRELEGIADGAQVPFHKLFLLHMDNIITNVLEREGQNQPVGCSTICVNNENQEVLGHTEDALAEVLNHFYIVSAHIISDTPQGKWQVTEERFTSLCYAGHLPGYTMSYNHHGLVFSINTLSAAKLYAGTTPRHFVTRALLATENFEQAQKVLRDSGNGAGDGCSINMTFINQEGDRLFHNFEMAPGGDALESQLDCLTISPGEYYTHCNKYLRMKLPEANAYMIKSSESRHAAFKKYSPPRSKQHVEDMLGDQAGVEFRVFHDIGPKDMVKTVAVGIFDCKERTWSLYADNPRYHEPLITLPMVLKKTTKIFSKG